MLQICLFLLRYLFINKKKLKQTNTSAHLVRYRFKICEGTSEGIRKERICERDEFNIWSER